MATDPRIALGTFSLRGTGTPFAGLVIGEHVRPIASLSGMDDMPGATLLDLLDRWTECWPILASAIPQLVQSAGLAAIRLADLAAHLPVRPRQIICAGANYRQHVIEMMADHDVGSAAGLDRAERRRHAERLMDHRAAEGQPYAFVKPVSALLDPGADLVVPADSAQTDWELELAVVIGRPCYRTTREKALDYVAGYTIANDISARDRLSRRDIPNLGLDYIAGKGAPGFFPLGPLIVPAAYVPHPQKLMLTLTLNGKVMQHESTADMIFPVAQLIEYVSTYMRLLPGDVISTGSPAGNGTHYGRYLRPGDRIEGHVEGLGMQSFRCVAETIRPGTATHRPFVPLSELVSGK